ISSVTHGRPGTAMMSFEKRLSGEQIKTVVGFIRNEFMLLDRVEKSQNESATPPQLATTIESQANVYPEGLVADEVWGKAFYLNNCFTCHGKNGDGKGPRAHFNQPRPRDFTSAGTRTTFDRSKLFQAIKTGKKATVMPAWGRVLTDQQVASVAEFVYQEFILTSDTQKKKSLK
ncbi:MAG: cytochrome c, partial [Gammaproteobacteria bacterium]|nr:cytochrome c [Gammaproteobacteria bacterium]